MNDTTDIEKKSLEAHVELCAERYRLLEVKLGTLEGNIGSLRNKLNDMHDLMNKIIEKRNDQLMAWGLGIMGVMSGVIAWLVTRLLP